MLHTEGKTGGTPARSAPPRRTLRACLLTLAAASIAGAAVAALLIFGGVYDISATVQHTRPVYALLELTMKQSVRRRAAAIAVPPLAADSLRAAGLQVFERHCINCHGAPGIAPQPYAQLLQPLPGPLTHAARQWRPQELYWIARYGVKMSGMPGWEGRIASDELWAVVAFLQQLPELSPDAYRALATATRPQPVPASVLPPDEGGADAVSALWRYGCHGCHVIPDVVGPTMVIGPPLERFGTRTLIAGRWPNTEDNLVTWLRNPQSLNARSAMPDLGVTLDDARIIARHLRALR